MRHACSAVLSCLAQDLLVYLYMDWWVGGVCEWRVLLQIFLGNKPPVRGKVQYMRTQWIIISLFFFSFSVSATGRSPLHTPPITCFSGPRCPAIYGTPLRLCTWSGEVAVNVCTACLIPESCGQFTRAAQLLTLFFFLMFICFLHGSKSR